MNGNKVVYIYSEDLIKQCDRLPTMLNRASIVQDLINAYRLLFDSKILLVKSLKATEEDLKVFHASNYVEFLKQINDKESFEEHDDELKQFGLDYDTPILPKLYDLICALAGGSLTAAKLLAARKCEIAINWFGGWHHAQRDSAEGFCYVNDIVLAIHKLTRTYKKILYLDMDIHHGDGVQNAFELSKNILTLSFHKFSPGFYPGTGKLEDTGSYKGRYYSINVPFLDGISSKNYLKLFFNIFPTVFGAFKPEVIVVQCGADCLNGDRVGESNLTLKTVGECVRKVLSYKIPTLFLGGGGYNFANSARLWTYLTSIIIDQTLNDDIPDSAEFFTEYKPSYELHIDEGYQKDMNTEDYINKLINTVLSYVNFID